MDRTIMYWENKGKLVPTRDLIKTPEQIEGIRRAGVINTGVLDAVAEAIHPGMNTQEIDDICIVTVLDCGEVNIYNVSYFQYVFLFRNTMTNDFID